MRKYQLLFILAIFLTLSSCRESKDSVVDLVFQANYGSEVLQYNTDYTLGDGMTFTIARSDFFISDVRLTADDGTEEVLFDYAQVDFEDSPGGVRLTTSSEIDATNYESITFGVGLNSSLNALSPVDFEADDVLNNSGYYWTAWDSYIFTKQEGNYDSDGDGVPDKGWIVHTGKDEIYQEVTIPLDYVIDEDNNIIRLIVDHEALFTVDGESIEFGIVHDPTDKEAFEGFYNRLRTSISADQ